MTIVVILFAFAGIVSLLFLIWLVSYFIRNQSTDETVEELKGINTKLEALDGIKTSLETIANKGGKENDK